MTTYGPTLIHRCSACDTEFKEPGIASGNTAHAVFRSDGKLDAPMLPVTPPLIACPSCRGVMTLYGRTPYAQFEPEWQVDNVLSDRAPGQFTDLQDLDKDKPAEKHADVPKFATPTVEECLSYLSSTSYSSEYEVAFRSYTVQRVNDQRLLRASDSVLASLEAPAASSTSNEGIKIISTRLLETFGTGRKSDTPTCENLKTLVSRGAQCAPLDQGQAANHIALLSLLDEIEDEFSVLTRAELLRELGRFTEALELLDREFEAGAVAEQIWLACDAGCSDPFVLAKDQAAEDYEEQWWLRRYKPEPVLEPTGDETPPVLEIANRDWWVKVLGMLHHNWALIDNVDNGGVVVYFFQDKGAARRATGYSWRQLKDRIAVVDSLTFDSLKRAEESLVLNGFSCMAQTPGPWVGEEPTGQPFDARVTEDRTFPKGSQ